MMKNIIEVHQLSKHFQVQKRQRGLAAMVGGLFSRDYRLIKAVDEVTFQIEPGELVGYLGPNGAGKSTTIKMLSGLLVPTSGSIMVNGFLPWKDRRKYVSGIGAVFGQRTTLWWDLPVIESLELLRFIYRIPSDRFHKNLSEFKQMLDMDSFMDIPVRALSLGQRMRADICAALLHDPVLLFFDEPTIGLDVVAKERIRRFIKEINATRGITMLLTTHDLSDVEKLCDRVIIIDHGKLLYDGKLNHLRTRFGGKRRLIVDFAEEYDQVNIDGATVTEHEGLRAMYEFERGTIAASELISRLSQKYRIVDLEVREPDIESTIRRIYEEKLLEV